MIDFKTKVVIMFKKPIARIVIFISLICTVSVVWLFMNRIKADFETKPNTFSVYEGEEIKLEVKYKLDGKVTYDVYNFSSDEVHTGNPYYLQKKSMGKWENVLSNGPFAFTMESHTILSNESKEYSFDSARIYGNLPIGKYRVVKEIELEGRDVYVAGEFRIVVPGLRQQITKKEAVQEIQRQYYDHTPNGEGYIDNFDNTKIEKVDYNGKKVYKITFQKKHGEWIESEVWYIDKSGVIVGNE